jgi:hypothetical protein
MAKVLWRKLSQTDFNAMSGSAALSGTGGGARHIALGISRPGNDIESFLAPLTGTPVTIPTEAGPKWPKATLTFTSNPERRGGEWLIADQKNNRHPALETEAGFPRVFDPANRPVVLVLEVEGAYHVDWRDEQTLNTVAPSIASDERGVATAPPLLVAEILLQPRLSPVDARVVHGQLQYVDATRAETASSDDIVEAVRNLHLPTAARLAVSLAGSNAGPGFSARFEAVHDLLGQTLTAERALQLAIQVRSLDRMTDAVAERLDEVTVADVAIFTADLMDLLSQLPAYRRFVEEARATVTPPADAVRAAASVATALEEQPDDIVEPQLKQAVLDVRVIAQESDDRLAAFGLVRTVGNAFRAVARFFNERVVTFGRRATQAFDDTAGKAFGKAIANLLVSSSIGGALFGLYELFPAEFAFVGHLIRLAKTLLF